MKKDHTTKKRRSSISTMKATGKRNPETIPKRTIIKKRSSIYDYNKDMYECKDLIRELYNKQFLTNDETISLQNCIDISEKMLNKIGKNKDRYYEQYITYNEIIKYASEILVNCSFYYDERDEDRYERRITARMPTPKPLIGNTGRSTSAPYRPVYKTVVGHRRSTSAPIPKIKGTKRETKLSRQKREINTFLDSLDKDLEKLENLL